MRPKVLIFGKFDILHPGHIQLIKKAKQFGQVTAVLESDKAIKSLRNYQPYHSQRIRKNNLEKLGLEVYIRKNQTAQEVLADLQPDKLVFGSDQKMLHHMFADFKDKYIFDLINKEIFKSTKLRVVLEDDNSGIYLVDKPKSVNSFKVVSVFRKVMGLKKVGFSGTLDPLASGLLIVATGHATRLLDWFHLFPKVYLADIRFGQTSDTYDLEGKIIVNEKAKSFSKKELENGLTKFLGRQKQQAPIYSAKKVDGKKLHKLARQGKVVDRPVKEIEIYSLKIKGFKYPDLRLEVVCSAGTYIRSLADDLGQSMKTGALLSDLRREKIGHFLIDKAVKLDDVDKPILAKKRIEPIEIIEAVNAYFMGLTD